MRSWERRGRIYVEMRWSALGEQDFDLSFGGRQTRSVGGGRTCSSSGQGVGIRSEGSSMFYFSSSYLRPITSSARSQESHIRLHLPHPSVTQRREMRETT